MKESIQIQSNNIGIDAGPFNLFSQVNGFTEAFETDITPVQLLIGFISYNAPVGTTTIRVVSTSEDCNEYVEETVDDVPICQDKVVVFQVCNSNALVDDNFDVFLNGVLIGNLDLQQPAQVGSVFIGSTSTLTIGTSDFTCPLNLMQEFFFDPALISTTNVIDMVNTQNNGNDNAGTFEIRNYELTGTVLSNACIVKNANFEGLSGDSFQFDWNYTQCCPDPT